MKKKSVCCKVWDQTFLSLLGFHVGKSFVAIFCSGILGLGNTLFNLLVDFFFSQNIDI